jgi:hypothetical protein
VLGGLVYGIMKNKNKYVATFLASAVVPIVNTAIFVLGALTMYDSMSVLASGEGVGVMYFLIIICAGVNFLIELGINLLVAPAIHGTIKALERVR